MKKSIAVICEYTIFPERIGGMDRFFIAYDKAAKEKGCQVTWFFKDAKKYEFYKNLTIVNAKNNNLESFFLEYCTSNHLEFDIVITHFLQPISKFFKIVKQQLKQPYIINIDHNPRPLKGFPFTKRIKNRLKGFLYGKYVDQLVGVSEYTRKHIINDFGQLISKKTMVVYNGIDTSSFSKQKIERDLKPIRFIVVSHLRESKGIQDLLNALKKLEASVLNQLSVEIYGDGPYKNELVRLQQLNELEQVVHFKGNSPEINKNLSNYSYLIQPTYMECFSLSILESLACNVPVITTTVGGNPEIIVDGKNGFLFEPKDVAALTKIIADVVEGNKKIIEDVHGIIEQEYTLQHMVKNHLKLLP